MGAPEGGEIRSVRPEAERSREREPRDRRRGESRRPRRERSRAPAPEPIDSRRPEEPETPEGPIGPVSGGTTGGNVRILTPADSPGAGGGRRPKKGRYSISGARFRPRQKRRTYTHLGSGYESDRPPWDPTRTDRAKQGAEGDEPAVQERERPVRGPEPSSPAGMEHERRSSPPPQGREGEPEEASTDDMDRDGNEPRRDPDDE